MLTFDATDDILVSVCPNRGPMRKCHLARVANGNATPGHEQTSVHQTASADMPPTVLETIAPDPSFLADEVWRSANSPRQAQAWEALWHNSARTIAQRVKGQFRNTIPDDFVEHAAGVVFERLARGMYDWRQGTFGSWCFTVLHRHAISLYHQSRRQAASLERLNAEPATQRFELPIDADAGAFEQMPALRALVTRLRGVLDDLAGRQELVSQVNYYAMLLLELRRGLVTRLKGRGILPGLAYLLPQWAGRADSAIVAELLPWRDAESELRIKAPYAPIGQIWLLLTPSIDAQPHDLQVDVLRLRIRANGAGALTGDAWFNWKRHLRKRLASLVDERIWNDVFAPWF